MDEKVRACIIVSGRVQGVSFRAKTQKKAQSLRIAGWVKNLPDGRVEAIFEGEKDKIQEMIDWVRKGPFLARVDSLEVEWEEYKDEFENFEQRY